MEFIDKNQSANREEAHEVIDAFLKEVDAKPGLYMRFADPLPNGTFPKKQMFALLMREQCRCCYCMRRLQTNGLHLSIEHVIPQHAQIDELEKYFAYGSTLDKALVQHEDDFLKGDKHTPPYPHTVAYENLVLSCDGVYPNSNEAQSCNTKRGSEFVPPVAFIREIHDNVEYYKNGDVRYLGKEEGMFPMVTILGLDVPILKAIRRIWAYILKHGIDVSNCVPEDVVFDIWKDVVGQVSQQESDVLLLFDRDNFWALLLQYDYFNNASVFVSI